jgi:hypothetical protein
MSPELWAYLCRADYSRRLPAYTVPSLTPSLPDSLTPSLPPSLPPSSLRPCSHSPCFIHSLCATVLAVYCSRPTVVTLVETASGGRCTSSFALQQLLQQLGSDGTGRCVDASPVCMRRCYCEVLL